MESLLWQTKAEEESRIVVKGYIRLDTKDMDLFMSVPMAIIQLIFNFFHYSPLIWDWEHQSICSQDYIYSSNRIKPFEQVPDTINTIKRVSSNCYRTIIAKNVISSVLYKRCFYEVLIEDAKPNRIDIFIGYIEYKKEGGYLFSDHLGSNSNKSSHHQSKE